MSYFCKMKVLIAGATGLVGNEITALFHANGIAVNYLTTRKNKIRSKDNLQGFYWNPSSNEIDLNCFNNVTAIINLAGASISKRWTPKYKQLIQSSRIDSLKTLHKGIFDSGNEQIKSFVSASAIGIYPTSLSNFYTEEETAVDTSFLGDVVDAWEKEINRFKDFKFAIATVRIGLVLSEKGGALPEMAKPIKYYVGAAFGSGEQWQSWIHISDLARIFLFIIEHQLSGIYNGVGPNPITNTKMVKEIAKALDRPLVLPNIPKFAMNALLGEMSYLLFSSQRVSSKKIEEEGFIFDHNNICHALEAIFKLPGKKNSTDTVYG